MKKYCYGVDIGENTVKLGIFTTKGKMLKNRNFGTSDKRIK